MMAVRPHRSPALLTLRLSFILAAGLASVPLAGFVSPPATPAGGGFEVIDDVTDPRLQFGLRLEAVLAELRDACLPPFIDGRSGDHELYIWQAPPARPCSVR